MDLSTIQSQPISHPDFVSLIAQVNKVFHGHPDKIEPLILGILSRQHVLLEDIPGVGKTTLAKAFARALGLDFGRIQFTPDLLPGDVVGMTIWNPESGKFLFRPGSIYHSFVLADEINRASPRTQSALLEAMQEQTVTVDGRTRELPKPFLVVATQNPSQYAGTFPLPEAQIDRFGLRVELGYPSAGEAKAILDMDDRSVYTHIQPIADPNGLLGFQDQVQTLSIPEGVKDFALKIAELTRKHPSLKIGLSPRALKQWVHIAKASAWLRNRELLLPEDLIHTAFWTLTHRLPLTGEAVLEDKTGASVLKSIIESLDLPSGL